MSDIEEEQYLDSDSSDNEEQHSKLLNTLSQLDNSQRVKPASRKEISAEVSEFNLQKGPTKKDLVNVNDLAKGLKQKAKHVAVSNKLKQVTKTSKTLPKPLEKSEEDKLKRVIGYENVKKQIKRWNAIVERNSLRDHLSFPLNKTSMKLQDSTHFLNNFQTQTPLEAEVAKILKQDKESKKTNDQIEYPLTLEEMIAKRKEMAHLRARLSYKEAKAHRQNKIKSKKYHRILKREKVRQQLKEFEILQKTDPSKALEKLQELDKNRILERASLRHRNTGKWAKNMTVKAKYDVESRKILAEQLKISKEMTNKVKALDSEDEEETVALKSKDRNDTSKDLIVSKDNPWSLEVSKEVQDFVSGYKKYWNEKNKELINEDNDKNNKSEIQGETLQLNGIQVSEEINKSEPIQSITTEKEIKETEQPTQTFTPKTQNKKKSQDLGTSDKKKKKEKSKNKITTSKLLKKGQDVASSLPKVTDEEELVTIRPTSGVWSITTVIDSPITVSENSAPLRKSKRKSQKSINCLFNSLEEHLVEKAKKKANAINKKLKKEENETLKTKQKKISDIEEKKLKLSLREKDMVLRPEMDVGLLEGDTEECEIPNVNLNESSNEKNESAVPEIDPKNFIQIKPKRLCVDIPEGMNENDDAIDDDADQIQQKMIEEAFGEDDVTAEFKKLKKDEEKDEVKISTSLPGWGEWGGSNIKPTKRKKRRFTLVKLPPRKDKKKMDTVINENENPNIKNHIVKNLPYPFMNAEAFESNLRAPIGRDWIPESAHLRLIQKPIETKLGTIISPMSEDEILKEKKVYDSSYGEKSKNKPNI